MSRLSRNPHIDLVWLIILINTLCCGSLWLKVIIAISGILRYRSLSTHHHGNEEGDEEGTPCKDNCQAGAGGKKEVGAEEEAGKEAKAKEWQYGTSEESLDPC